MSPFTSIPSNPEKLSIILELISFFLVTIDLFGRARLERLQERFGNLISSVKKAEFGRTVYKVAKMDKSVRLNWNPYLTTAMVVLAVYFFLCLKIAGVYGAGWLLLLIPLGLIVGLLGMFAGLYLIYLLIVILESVVDAIFAVLLFLFRRMKLEGVMIITGAVLFLISKIIAYANITPK